MKDQCLKIKSLYLLLFVFFINNAIHAQVKIGGIPYSVNPDAVLELESANKGLLLPRLGLISTNNPYPLTAFVEGMFVYDTATTGDVMPGLYYCDGSKWIRINKDSGSIVPAPNGGWALSGNSGTNPANNFIGTMDGNDLVFKTNNTERLRLTKYGWLGVGTPNPQAALHVKGQVKIDSLQSGNINTDSVLVADGTGRIKAVHAGNFLTNVKKTTVTVTTSGQWDFNTPALITDPERIQMYRNGVLVNFSITGTSTIRSEIACQAGDEVKIIQIL